MTTTTAPGLTGDWLNAWFAAIGITSILHGARLSWSADAVPVAVVTTPDEQPLAEAIAEALPDLTRLAGLAIATPMRRNVDLVAYRRSADVARHQRDWSLAASVTDLVADNDQNLPHSRFDPPAPRGTTLYTRVVACREAIDAAGPAADRVAATLAGRARRVQTNGLGFDYRRIPAASHPDADVYVDPVIECLAFEGLRLFPIRGDGRGTSQRGWVTLPGQRVATFVWPIWRDPLDLWAIDALLDVVHTRPTNRPARLGVTRCYQAIPYQPAGSSDVRRGYASTPLT